MKKSIEEGLNLNIDKEILDDQRTLEVSTNVAEDEKIEDKEDFENFKVLYANAIKDKCLEDFDVVEDNLLEDTAEEMYLASKTYVPEEDKKADGELEVKTESVVSDYTLNEIKKILDSEETEYGYSLKITNSGTDEETKTLDLDKKDLQAIYKALSKNKVTESKLVENETRQSIYDELCRVLTDYETGPHPAASKLYDMLVKIQNNWENVITANLDESKLTESVEVHNELNPKLWNADNTLKPEVYEKLVDIYEEFIKHIDVPLNIVDVEVVGSNASYNYNENSDIDLHVIVNSDVNYMDKELLRLFYNSKKGSFNDNYSIDIEGIPVELYIEDVNDGNATNGRFSILDNEWVVEPKPITYEIPDITDELNDWLDRAIKLLDSEDEQGILDYINELYMLRKLGLAEDGEASVGNLVFKELRNLNILVDLKDRYYELKSDDLSL